MKAGTVICIGLVVLSGCSTTSRENDVASRGFSLTKSDILLAQALAHYGRGVLSEQQEGVSGKTAADHFIAAGNLDTGSRRPFSRAALNLLRANMPDEALAALQEAAARNPDSANAWIDLATMAHLLQRFNLARDAYQQALRINPSNNIVRINIAKIAFSQQQDDAALELLAAVFEDTTSAPTVISYVFSQALEFLESNTSARALPCLLFIAEHDPDQRGRFLHLAGEVYEQLDQTDKAAIHYRRAIKEKDTLPDSYINLAVIRMPEDSEEALQLIKDGEARFAENPALLYAGGFLYASRGDYSNAVVRLEGFVEKVGREQALKLGSDFLMVYGSSLERVNRIEEAVEIFEHCIKLYPDNHEALNYVAYIWAERGTNLSKARKYVNRAIEHEPENGAYLDTLGWIFYQQQHYEKALEFLLQAHHFMPDDPVITEHIGDTYHALKRFDEAAQFWNKSLELMTDNKNKIIRKIESLNNTAQEQG